VLIGDLIIASFIERGIAEVRADGRMLTDMLDMVPDDFDTQARRWLGNPRLEIPVRTGFPAQPPKAPMIVVMLESEEEDLTPIGMDAAGNTVRDADGNFLEFAEAQATFFNASWVVQVLSPNVADCLLLYLLARYALLRHRGELTLNYNLYQQQLAGGDFRPPPEWYPDIIFSRGLTLRATYPAKITYHHDEKYSRVDVNVHTPEWWLQFSEP
jgi:hypothetical protein